LALIQGRLDGLNPLATLERGYAVVEQSDSVVSRYADLRQDEPFTIRFQDGVVTVMVKEEEA
jgi:exonuclease VII large subunit